ncbi:MAG: GNAT family N-acetyltransferase [Mesorhizobium sp.]|nr:GNAT family N-acetyltransferase [Mesorhizobium sp.]
MIPTLETERLVLRAFMPGDVEAFAGFYASGAARFVGGPEDLVSTWKRIAAYAGCWALRGYGKFVVVDKGTGRAVGIVGPTYPEGWPEPEIGWTILPEFEGRGYAAEAAARAISFAYDDLGWTTAMSAIFPGNERSFRLAGRLGAHHEGAVEVKPFGMLEIWRHLPPAEFRAHLGRLN